MHTADLSELDEEYGDEKTEQEAVQKMVCSVIHRQRLI